MQADEGLRNWEGLFRLPPSEGQILRHTELRMVSSTLIEMALRHFMTCDKNLQK